MQTGKLVVYEDGFAFRHADASQKHLMFILGLGRCFKTPPPSEIPGGDFRSALRHRANERRISLLPCRGEHSLAISPSTSASRLFADQSHDLGHFVRVAGHAELQRPFLPIELNIK